VKIGPYTVIKGSGKLSIGAGSFCGAHCVIGCNEKVVIGREVMIADGVSIRDTDHVFSDSDTPMLHQGISTMAVTIEDDVWVGYGASILKGVSIGSGAIVASGAVVTKDVPAGAIVGGVPARVIRDRYRSVSQ
jgi:acetyltransferase-like isoleucine patch superfamily enzyme